ncbi:MAG: polar amino acid transport system substrate-binding protein [bacterium]|jgi:polar amino acid transport system substrate-binding protein
MILKCILYLKFFLFLILCLFTTNIYAETWKIAALEWPPYSSSKMLHQGKSIQILKDLLKKRNIQLIVNFYPWRRAQRLSRKNLYMGYYPAWIEEVQKGFVASKAIDYSTLGIMTYSGSNIANISIQQLFKKYRIGLVRTYVYSKYIQKLIKKYPNHVDYAPNEISLVKKLSIKRNELAITDPKVMLYLSKKLKLSNIRILNINLERKPLVIAIRKNKKNQYKIKILQQLLK